MRAGSPLNSARPYSRAVAREGHQGEELLVHVIFDEKISWETCRGELVFIPGAVILLPVDEVFGPEAGRLAIRRAALYQAHQRPCRLRGCADAFSAQARFQI